MRDRHSPEYLISSELCGQWNSMPVSVFPHGFIVKVIRGLVAASVLQFYCPPMHFQLKNLFSLIENRMHNLSEWFVAFIFGYKNMVICFGKVTQKFCFTSIYLTLFWLLAFKEWSCFKIQHTSSVELLDCPEWIFDKF